MKSAAVAFAVLLTCTVALSQRPSDPALLIPQNAPELDYMAVANPVTVPADSRPMSRQMAHAELMDKSATPAAAAIRSAAASGLLVTAAIASIKPLPTSAPAATPQRPMRKP